MWRRERHRPEEEFQGWLEDLLRADEAPDREPAPSSGDAAAPGRLLSAVQQLRAALRPEPREEFRAASHQRFLLATGKRLRDAFSAEPRPAFVAAVRERLLLAANKVGLRPRRTAPLGLPVAVPAVVAAVLALSLSAFMAYTVTTSGDSLPGQWQYPVKRSVERARLALAFSEDGRHAVRVDLAQERLWEIETLAERGQPIGKSVLSALQHETESIAEHLDVSGAEPEESQRLAELAGEQQAVLVQVAPLVEPDAREDLEAAQLTSREAQQKAFQVMALAQAPPSEEIGAETDVPSMGLTPVAPSPAAAVTGDMTDEPASADGDQDETPDEPAPGATGDAAPVATPATTPEAAPTTTPRVVAAGLTLFALPEDETAGLRWDRMVIGTFSTAVPGEDSGWHLTDIALVPNAPVPTPLLVRLVNLDGTSIIAINPRTGDVYWYVFDDGTFREVRLRQAVDGQVTFADPNLLNTTYGTRAAVPLHIAASIEFSPEPTPTSTPPPTPTPVQDVPAPVP